MHYLDTFFARCYRPQKSSEAKFLLLWLSPISFLNIPLHQKDVSLEELLPIRSTSVNVILMKLIC